MRAGHSDFRRALSSAEHRSEPPAQLSDEVLPPRDKEKLVSLIIKYLAALHAGRGSCALFQRSGLPRRKRPQKILTVASDLGSYSSH
jgi:hypothetical protein